MENNIEYIKLFMEYEHENVPVVFFYEIDLCNNRLTIREIEVYSDRQVKLIDDPYRDVIEVTPVPTVDELNAKIWGNGFFATAISKMEFDEIWNSGIYSGRLTAT